MLDPSLGLEADLSPDPLLAASPHSPAGAWAFCICLGYRFGTLTGVSEGGGSALGSHPTGDPGHTCCPQRGGIGSGTEKSPFLLELTRQLWPGAKKTNVGADERLGLSGGCEVLQAEKGGPDGARVCGRGESLIPYSKELLFMIIHQRTWRWKPRGFPILDRVERLLFFILLFHQVLPILSAKCAFYIYISAN